MSNDETTGPYAPSAVDPAIETTNPNAPAGANVSHPVRVGSYRVLRLLGEGGMGAVFLAEQEHPKRQVALKVIRGEHVSAESLARFRQETAVLARLQHPGIAQIFEAGTAESAGRAQPFFAMEYVAGRSLTQFADEQKLSTRQRLELLVKVCEAVEHAHQKGVIHRDLKPGNIVVDAAGQPKILDFGIARATDSDLQAATLATSVGQLVGTVPYMSPEQAQADPELLDTRSDVYALGVISYELLSGRLPHDLRGRATIVAKALEKEKDRRYQSAADLARDVRRHLNDEPPLSLAT